MRPMLLGAAVVAAALLVISMVSLLGPGPARTTPGPAHIDATICDTIGCG